METRTKSDILREISQCIEENNNKIVECILKKSNFVVTINVQFEERKSFVDENGVKWIKE